MQHACVFFVRPWLQLLRQQQTVSRSYGGAGFWAGGYTACRFRSSCNRGHRMITRILIKRM